MCGIAGIVAPSVDKQRLIAMTDAIAHRGPDGSGAWVSPQGNIGLGHRRLSILDLSPAGAQPMHAHGVSLVFNGEIYNYLELREQLPGYNFSSHTDTEVIIAAYLRWGHECLTRFNGMFAFALWDEKKQELFCARDRLGVKPFFYAPRNHEWLFGSEVKAILAAGVSAAPDMGVWGRYLVHGAFERAHESFFAGVSALAPGHYAIVKPDGSYKVTRWWYLPDRVAEPWTGSETDAAETLAGLLDEAVKLRLRSDVPVALNLTGGLDSSSVAQSFLRQSAGETHVFTAAFNDPRYDEDQYADMVVKGHRCQRHVTRLAPEQVPMLAAEAIRSQEAPFGGIGMIAYETIHREMQKLGLKVGLEGQGGDELFAGYAYYQTPGAGNVYQDGTSYLAPECIAPHIRETATETVYPTPFNDQLMNALYRDLTETKLVRVLRMNDRKAMAHGVELRQPFLDYRLVEFAMRLPADVKIKNGFGKYILRQAMDKKLPQEIVWAKKRPVVTPQREWMQTHLKRWVEELVADRRFEQRGFFDIAAVKNAVKTYTSGQVENAFPVWQWINTELWFREFVDA